MIESVKASNIEQGHRVLWHNNKPLLDVEPGENVRIMTIELGVVVVVEHDMLAHRVFVITTKEDGTEVPWIFNETEHVIIDSTIYVDEHVEEKSEASGILIAGFPGIGKSWLYNNTPSCMTICDSDSSQFSWIHVDGVRTRNPNFISDYIKHIQEQLKTHNIVMVSTHADVLAEFERLKMYYYLVYPYQDLKTEYLERYVKRGSPEAFVKLMDEKWDAFMSDICMSKTYAHRWIIGPGETLQNLSFITVIKSPEQAITSEPSSTSTKEDVA